MQIEFTIQMSLKWFADVVEYFYYLSSAILMIIVRMENCVNFNKIDGEKIIAEKK